MLGFLLNLAGGSEVGNSQAGKRRGSTGRLGTRDPEPRARNPGGQGRLRWGHLGRDRQVRVLGAVRAGWDS